MDIAMPDAIKPNVFQGPTANTSWRGNDTVCIETRLLKA